VQRSRSEPNQHLLPVLLIPPLGRVPAPNLNLPRRRHSARWTSSAPSRRGRSATRCFGTSGTVLPDVESRDRRRRSQLYALTVLWPVPDDVTVVEGEDTAVFI